MVALGAYSGPLRTAVLGLKFRNRSVAARELGAILGAKLGHGCDALVPVPLHVRRLLARGFNQAEAVAAGIAAESGIPLCSGALLRARHTTPQSSLALRERTTNVADAFVAGPEASRLCGARVMIVDDVVTTGATIAACAGALRYAGVAQVTAAALAVKL